MELVEFEGGGVKETHFLPRIREEKLGGNQAY